MPTWTETFAVDFTPDADAPAGAAGTTTGAGHGMVDVQGNRWSRSGGRLKGVRTSGLDIQRSQLTVFAPSNSNQRLRCIIGPGDFGGGFVAALRSVLNALNFRSYVGMEGINYNGSGGNQQVVQLVKRYDQQQEQVYENFGFTVNVLHSYAFDTWVLGNAPFTLYGVFENVTTGTVLKTFAPVSVAQSELQNLNSVALFPGNSQPYSGFTDAYIKQLSVYEETGTAPLVPGPITATRVARANTLSIEPEGGTSPFTYAWHGKEDSIDWVPGPATLLAGLTTATPTDTPVTPGKVKTYRVVVVDAAPTPQTVTSDPFMVDNLLPTFELREGLSDGSVPLILVEIGDSITNNATGYNAHKNRLINTYGVNTIHLSNQGHNSSEMVTHWNPATDTLGYVAAAIAATNALVATYPTGLVLWSIRLGTNDARTSNASVASYNAVRDALVEEATSRGWLVELKSLPYALTSGGMTLAQQELALGYRLGNRNAVNDRDVFLGGQDIWIETYNNQGSYYNSGDPVHLNSTGQTVMGEDDADWSAAHALNGGGGTEITGYEILRDGVDVTTTATLNIGETETFTIAALDGDGAAVETTEVLTVSARAVDSIRMKKAAAVVTTDIIAAGGSQAYTAKAVSNGVELGATGNLTVTATLVPDADDPDKANVLFDMTPGAITQIVCQYEDELPLELGDIDVTERVANTGFPNTSTGNLTLPLYTTSTIVADNEGAEGLYTVIGLKGHAQPFIHHGVSVPDAGGLFDIETGVIS